MNIKTTFADLVKAIEQLQDERNEDKATIEKLRLDIEKLRRERAVTVSSDRQLKDAIDSEKYNYVFGWKVDKATGKLSKCKTKTESENVWANLRKHISIPIFNYVSTSAGSSSNFNFTGKPLDRMTDAEYEIFKNVMIAIVDIMYDAKKQLEVTPFE